MKVSVSQVYVQPKVKFHLSWKFQVRLASELSSLVEPSDAFKESDIGDFDITFNMSAKAEIEEPEIAGPVKHKKDRDIEFAIYLPHNPATANTRDGIEECLVNLLRCISTTLESLGVGATKVRSNSARIVESIINDPSMIDRGAI